MAKIKRKVEMTLSELIEWGFKSNIKNRIFVPNQANYRPVIFDSVGWINFSGKYFYPAGDTFTVEVEEEITEDIKLPKCLEISFDQKSGKDVAVIHENWSVENITEQNSKCFSVTKTVHLVNDDGTVTLVWKDGELVGEEKCLN